MRRRRVPFLHGSPRSVGILESHVRPADLTLRQVTAMVAASRGGMSPGEAIERARLAIRRGRLRISFHTRHDRMGLRNASRADIEEAIETCSGAVQNRERTNRWRLTGGVDLDGDGLDVVVAFDDDGITCVVTILDPKDES